MRLRMMVVAGLFAAATILPTAVQAQFPFDPRALLNRLTAPLRQILPHPPVRSHPASRGPAQEAAGGEEPMRLGLVGPPSWPTAYEDAIGYTFWPQEYEAEYRWHGFNDITLVILAAPERGPASADARRATTGSASTAPPASTCEDAKAGADWPKAALERMLDVTDNQRGALESLQRAIDGAAKSVRANACRATEAASPAERLEAMVQQMWAVQNAGIVVRGPLKNFYDTLSDTQKAKLSIAPEKARADVKPGDNPMNRKECAQQAGVDERLMRQIQQTVRPTAQQKQSVEMLARTAGGMSQYLMASCAQPTPEDPLARLDAANGRLTALNYAATSMEVALSQFTAALTNEQRQKFETMGR